MELAEVPPTVRISYTNQTATTIGALKYSTKEEDTHNAYNTSTGEFTAPVSGLYTVELVRLSGATVGMYTYINKNGGTYRVLESSAQANTRVNLFCSLRLNTGDKTTIVVTSQAPASDSSSWIQITRIGS